MKDVQKVSRTITADWEETFISFGFAFLAVMTEAVDAFLKKFRT